MPNQTWPYVLTTGWSSKSLGFVCWVEMVHRWRRSPATTTTLQRDRGKRKGRGRARGRGCKREIIKKKTFAACYGNFTPSWKHFLHVFSRGACYSSLHLSLPHSLSTPRPTLPPPSPSTPLSRLGFHFGGPSASLSADQGAFKVPWWMLMPDSFRSFYSRSLWSASRPLSTGCLSWENVNPRLTDTCKKNTAERGTEKEVTLKKKRGERKDTVLWHLKKGGIV